MNHIEEICSSNIMQMLRMQAANEQAALHAVQLAVARWTCADVEFELANALPSSRRSRWHAAAQNDFMAWLNAGGFAQPEVGGLPAAELAGKRAGCNDHANCRVQLPPVNLPLAL